MKKFYSLLLALIACAGTIFAERVQIGDLYYNLNAEDLTAEVTYQKQWSAANYSYLTAVNIPESVEYNSVTYSVTSIGERAFAYCAALTSIEIPNTVTSIGNDAFNSCTALTSIEIPNSVTSIGELAFVGCTGLTNVTIPNGVTSIGNYAFNYCTGLTSMVVASGNTTYDSRDNCNAIIETSSNTLIAGCQNSIIPNTVTSIGVAAFWGCTALTSIEIPNSVTSIGNDAFNSCTGLTSIEIPNSVTSIGGSAFYDCSGLTSVTIGNSVTSIGESTFSSCSGLTNVTIPNSVTSIGDAAFAGCSGLTSIEIPNSVTSIGGSAFAGCSGLTSVTNYAVTPQTINSYVFYNVNKSSCTLYVPEGSINLYQAADGWEDFGNIQAIADEQTSIDQITNNQSRITNKIIKDNQIYILTGDKTYTVTGQQLK